MPRISRYHHEFILTFGQIRDRRKMTRIWENRVSVSAGNLGETPRCLIYQCPEQEASCPLDCNSYCNPSYKFNEACQEELRSLCLHSLLVYLGAALIDTDHMPRYSHCVYSNSTLTSSCTFLFGHVETIERIHIISFGPIGESLTTKSIHELSTRPV